MVDLPNFPREIKKGNNPSGPFFISGASVIVFLIILQLPFTVLAQSLDVYAIYSDLIAKSRVVRTGPGNVPTDDQIYLIEATTATSQSRFGGPSGGSFEASDSCDQVPSADAAGYREILADYNQRRKISMTLASQFSLAKPYQLLTTAEVDRFLHDALEATPQVLLRDVPPPVNRNPLYQKSKRVFRLGDVYFNKSRTLALVYFSVYTTSLDGYGGWRALRKTSAGRWEENKSWGCRGWGSIR